MEITLQKLIELGADEYTQQWFSCQFGNSGNLAEVLNSIAYFGEGNILRWLKENLDKNIEIYTDIKVIDFSDLPKDVDYIIFWNF